MDKQFKSPCIAVNQLSTGAPIYQPFADAYMACMTGLISPAPQTVCAGKVWVPALSPIQTACVRLAEYTPSEVHHTRDERMIPVPNLQREVGRLWAYDDATYVSLFRRHARAAPLRVGVIGHDPA